MLKNITILKYIILSLTFFGCTKSNSEICIGFSANLTGTGSDLGVFGMYGAQLAIDEINNKGGINGSLLKLNIKNDKADKNRALDVDKELISEGCTIIVGHMISSVTEKVIPFINSSENILMISPTISTETLSSLDDNFLRVIPSNVKQIEYLAKLIDLDRIDEFGIIYNVNNILFAETFIHWVKRNLNSNFDKTISYNSSVLDSESVLNVITQTNISQVLIIGSGEDVANFAQFFKKKSVYIDIILRTWAFSESLFLKGGKTVNGYKGVNFIDIDSQSEEFLEFKNLFIQKYGIDPSFSSIMSYESVKLIVDAMQNSSTYDVSKIREYILNKNSYNGLFNDLNINPFGDADRNIYFYTIEDGKFIRINP